MLLHHLDTFIGVVVILTGISLLIMILTQLISSLLNLRGSNLKNGLQVLLENLDPKGRLAKEADLIAEKVLTHPLITDSTREKAARWKRASAIRKEELTEIIKLLKDSPETAQAIVKIEMAARDLEQHVETWFNKTMDRVSQRFKVHTRLWTAGFSLIIALALQLDVLVLYDQISTDAELRAGLVASASAMEQRAQEVFAQNGSQDVQTLIARADSIRTDLEKTDFKLIPEHGLFTRQSGYWNTIRDASGKDQSAPVHWLGTLAMAALLSLGAPFWFNVLNKLTSLRSILARKEEEERKDDQNS